MREAIVTLTVTKRVQLDPHDFGELMTDEQMLAEEICWATDMPHEWMVYGEPNFEVKGEIVDETTQDMGSIRG